MTEEQTPGATPEEMAAAGAVGQAAAAAIEANQGDPAAAREAATAAVEQTAAEKGLSLSDDDVSKIVDGLIGALEARGAFEPPPAAPAAPAPPASPAEPAAPAAETPAPVPVVEEPPRKRTLAERFAGS